MFVANDEILVSVESNDSIEAKIQEFTNCEVVASQEVFVEVPQPVESTTITVEVPGTQGPRGPIGPRGLTGKDGKDAIVESIPNSFIDNLF